MIATFILLVQLYSGPTIPPGPWDDGDVKDGGTKIAFDIEMPTCYPCDTK